MECGVGEGTVPPARQPLHLASRNTSQMLSVHPEYKLESPLTPTPPRSRRVGRNCGASFQSESSKAVVAVASSGSSGGGVTESSTVTMVEEPAPLPAYSQHHAVPASAYSASPQRVRLPSSAASSSHLSSLSYAAAHCRARQSTAVRSTSPPAARPPILRLTLSSPTATLPRSASRSPTASDPPTPPQPAPSAPAPSPPPPPRPLPTGTASPSPTVPQLI